MGQSVSDPADIGRGEKHIAKMRPFSGRKAPGPLGKHAPGNRPGETPELSKA